MRFSIVQFSCEIMLQNSRVRSRRTMGWIPTWYRMSIMWVDTKDGMRSTSLGSNINFQNLSNLSRFGVARSLSSLPKTYDDLLHNKSEKRGPYCPWEANDVDQLRDVCDSHFLPGWEGQVLHNKDKHIVLQICFCNIRFQHFYRKG